MIRTFPLDLMPGFLSSCKGRERTRTDRILFYRGAECHFQCSDTIKDENTVFTGQYGGLGKCSWNAVGKGQESAEGPKQYNTVGLG